MFLETSFVRVYALRLLVVVLFLLGVPLTASGVGDSAVGGVGSADVWTSTQQCVNLPLTVQIAYLSGHRAIVVAEMIGTPSCPLMTGGAIGLGQVHYGLGQTPPVRFTFACSGDAPTGVYCSGGATQIWVSPYRGLGGTMSINVRGSSTNLDGVFTAA
jgi:hypothetical protein